jgi:hypothetical protein
MEVNRGADAVSPLFPPPTGAMGRRGHGGHPITRTSLTEPEPPIGKAEGHQGLHTCFWVLGTGDR